MQYNPCPMDEPKPTPGAKINKLIDDLFPTHVEAPPTFSRITHYKNAASPARQELFLEHIEAGWSETKARKATHVSASVVEYWKGDPEFLARLNDAFKSGTDYLKDLAFLKAHDSDAVLLRLLEAREPETFKPKAGGGSGHVNVIIAPLFEQGNKLDNPQIIVEHNDGRDA